MINSILVYNDHIEITFNYKEGCKIIPFEEIQKAASSAMRKAAGSDFFYRRDGIMPCPPTPV